MNEQQPYEKYLAEKFQQLPLPDVEPNWQQMKSLLDKEMPRGGGYWRWITGIGLLLIMLGGTWYLTSHNETITSMNVGEVRSADSTKQSAASNTSSANYPKKDVHEKNDVAASQKKSSDQTRDQELNKSVNTKDIEENLHNNLRAETPIVSNKINKKGNKIALDKNDVYLKKADVSVEGNSSTNEPQRDEAIISGKKINSGKKDANKTVQLQRQVTSADQNYLGKEAPSKTLSIQYNPQNIIPDFAVEKLIGDSIEKNYYSGVFPETKLESQQKSGKLSGKTKSSKSRDMDAGENKNLAFGFSLPLGFPLGDQKPAAYNINAKPNTVTDFIPVPHMQYHINSKVYLQTELQLVNPQFIQPVLLYQQKTAVSGANSIYYNSIYAEKLYYFNIPVGIHYSPFQHFYLGTGLQFSSLVSGVALYEESSSVVGSGRNTIISQEHNKFKNDSISNKIDNSEFRLMLDANYYWKQFTVGLRYNQALSNYVSFRLNIATPLFQDKNKSLQFYLRYNLWEDHKRKKK